MKKSLRDTEDLLDLAVDLDQLILLETETLLQEPFQGSVRLREGLHKIGDRTMKSADLLREIQSRIRPPE